MKFAVRLGIVLLALTVAGCDNVLAPPGESEAAPRVQGVSIAVLPSATGSAPAASRALPTDGSVSHVEVYVVWASDHVYYDVAWLTDSNGDGVWTGTVDMSTVSGTFIFRAVAWGAGEKVLYFGESGPVAVVTNEESVQIATEVGGYGLLVMEPYPDNGGGVFGAQFTAPSDLYYQLDGAPPPNASTLKSTGIHRPRSDDLNVMRITGLEPGASHTIYFMGECLATGAQTGVIEYEITTTETPTVSVTGTTNLPAGWTVAALNTTTDDVVFGEAVAAGTPNTWSVDVATGRPEPYDVVIAFLDIDDPDGHIVFDDDVVSIETSDIAGVHLFADVLVAGIAPEYVGRTVTLRAVNAGDDPLVESPAAVEDSLIVTAAGGVYVNYWPTQDPNTAYDLYAWIDADGEDAARLVTRADGGPLSSYTTDAFGNLASLIAVDAATANYHEQISQQDPPDDPSPDDPVGVLEVDVEGIYHTTRGDFDGRWVELLVFEESADPLTADHLAYSLSTIGASEVGGASFSGLQDAVGFGDWTPAPSTTYDLYLYVHGGGDDPAVTITGSGSSPLASFTTDESGEPPPPISIDAHTAVFHIEGAEQDPPDDPSPDDGEWTITIVNIYDTTPTEFDDWGASLAVFADSSSPEAGQPLATADSLVGSIAQDAATFSTFLDPSTGTEWTPAASTIYDVYLAVIPAAGGSSVFVKGSDGAELGTFTTDASGNPPAGITIDAESATYEDQGSSQDPPDDPDPDDPDPGDPDPDDPNPGDSLRFDVVQIYDSAPGEFETGRWVDMRVYAESADPAIDSPLAYCESEIGVSTPDSATFAAFYDSGTNDPWTPSTGTTYGVYLEIWDSESSRAEFRVAGSATPTPLAVFTGGDSMPISIDASSASYLPLQ